MLVASTGAILAFEKPLDRFTNRDVAYVAPGGERLSYATLLAAAQQARPDDTLKRFVVPVKEDEALVVETKGTFRIYVDPYTARVLGVRDQTADPMWNLVEFHTSFFVSSQLAAASALLVIVNALCGAVIWWPRGRDKLRGFRVSFGRSASRLLYDLHSAIGGWAGVMLVLLAVTGVVHTYKKGVRAMIASVTHEESTLDHVPETSGQEAQSVDAILASPLADICRGYREVTVTLVEPRRLMCQTPGKPLASIYFDPATLAVTAESSQRHSTAVDAIYLTNYPLHIGAIGGLPTQILWSAAAFALAFLPVTGVTMWARRRRR